MTLTTTLWVKLVYILILLAICSGAYWYFFVYLKSPHKTLETYVGALNRGDSTMQFNLLTSSSKSQYSSQEVYVQKFPQSKNLIGKIVSFSLTSVVINDTSYTADVDMKVLVNGTTATYTDHYMLEKESGLWRVDLEKSTVKNN